MTLTDGVPPRTDGARPPGRAGAVLQRRLQLTCIVGACLFVFWQMRPDLLFSNTTPAGGDMAAHVWGPAFLRDHLLPAGRLSGWAPDWYAGFPAYHFYMVLPSLAIALASFVIPYGVAFKLVAVAGLVTLPLAAALFVRLAGLRFPAPAVAAMFTLPFLFDTSFSIYGGNVASTLAGEFAYSISLSLMLVYLGVVLRGLRTGRHRVLAGVLLALVGLTHLIPAIFAVAATGVALAMQPGRRPLRWVAVTGMLGAALAAFWLLPFWWRRAYYHNIDWVNLSEYWPNLVRDDWSLVLVGAWAGLLVGILRRRRLALYLAALAALAAGAYRWIPQGVLWNARLLPFYYLTMLLLAALGVATLLVTLAVGDSLRDLPTGSPEGPPGGGEARRRRRWLPNDSLRLRLALAALLPVGAVAVAVDDLVAGSAALRALIEVLPGVEASTAPDRAADVAHLALIVLVAAAAVTLIELLRSLRAQGLRPKSSGLVVLGTPAPAAPAPGGIRPASSTATRPAGVIRPLGAIAGPGNRGGWALSAGTAAIALVLVVAVAYPLRALGAAGHESSDGRYGLRVAPNVVVAGTTQKSFLPFWVYWNFSGYESKQPREGIGGYDEYYRVVTTMAAVAAERGCGRVMWEYGLKRLDSYGSPMSLMLLPHWTDGCLASMEGLFFESTQTVPFHFINQDELSVEPSRPVRAVPYGGTNLATGTEHMQLFGVRYYMAFSDSLIAEARAHEDLIEVAAQPPWVAFEVADAPLVSPLAAEPVVIEGADDPERWLDVAVGFYTGYAGSGALDTDAAILRSGVFPAAGGPEGWAEVEPGVDLPVRALADVGILDVSTTESSIGFRVDRTGVPVLVKASYFPNWQVDGAAGPYRVAPNFMVVVPDETEVTLTYGWTAVDVLAWVITAIALIVAVALWRNPHVWTAEPDRRAPWE